MVRFSVKIFQSFKVSCMVPNIGAAGGNQQHNGLCELTQVYMACYILSFPLLQNIINGKIYLILWFWFGFLVLVSFIFVFYRLLTILSYTLRFNLLYKTVEF